MRIGAFEAGFSASPPSLDVSVGEGGIVLEAEAIALGAEGAPAPAATFYAAPPPIALEQSAIPTMASRYGKYLAVAGDKYGGTFVSAESQRPGSGGGAAAPSYDRGVYVGDTEVSTGAIVAGVAVALGLGALAAWRLGVFGR